MSNGAWTEASALGCPPVPSVQYTRYSSGPLRFLIEEVQGLPDAVSTLESLRQTQGWRMRRACRLTAPDSTTALPLGTCIPAWCFQKPGMLRLSHP